MKTRFNKFQRRTGSRRSIFEPLEDRKMFAAVYWDGGGGNTNWNTALNWSNNLVPTSQDDVSIIGTPTVQVPVGGGAGAKSLTLGDGINGAPRLIISDYASFGVTATSSVKYGATLEIGADSLVSFGGTITGPTFYNSGNVILRGGELRGTSVYNTGTIESDGAPGTNFAGDYITATVTNYGTLRLASNGAGHFLASGTITNYGTIEMSGTTTGTPLQLGSPTVGTTVINTWNNLNAGVFNVLAGGQRVLNGAIQNSSNVNVGGPLTIHGYGTASSNDGSFQLQAQLTLDGATFNYNQPFNYNSYSGTLSVTHGSTMNLGTGLSNGIVTNMSFDASTINGPATLTDEAYRTMNISNSTVNAPVMNKGTLRIDGIVTAAQPFTNNGTFEIGLNDAPGTTAEMIMNGGAFTNASGATLHAAGMSLVYGQFTNNGTMNLDAVFTVSTDSVGGLNAGTINVNNGAGRLRFYSGSNLNFTSVGTIHLVNGGSIDAYGHTLQLNGGRLDGAGIVWGNVVNNGTVAPGGPIGTISINGNYTQTSAGTLEAELNGTTPGTQYDQLIVNGNASLDGTLAVSRVNGFTPASNDTFYVLTAWTRSGTFASVTGTALPYGFSLKPSYTTTSARLGVSYPSAIPPVFRISDASTTEWSGTGAPGSAVFTVTRDYDTSGPATVRYSTADGSAFAPGDYQSASGMLTFAPGEQTKTITVRASYDPTVEPDENFYVNLSAPTGAAILDGQGVGTIVDPQYQKPTIYVMSSDHFVEGQAGSTFIDIPLYVFSPNSEFPQSISVDFTTADGTATVADGDYGAVRGTLNLSAPGGMGHIRVPIAGDTRIEQDETFQIKFSNAVNCNVAPSVFTVTITNDDPAPGDDFQAQPYVPNPVSFSYNLSGHGGVPFAPDAMLNLQGHTFRFAGASLTGLFPSASGAISLTPLPQDNSDLYSFPTPVIAPLWDAVTSSQTLWAIVPGSTLKLNSASQYLVVQWTNAVSEEFPDNSPVTVQAMMELDTGGNNGEIVFCYFNTPTNNPFMQSATIGVRDQTHVLQLGFNLPTMPVPFTGTSCWIRITQTTTSIPAVPAAPSAPDLIDADDQGVSNTDNLTSVAQPTFVGTAAAGTTVHLFSDAAIEIGSAVADANGNYSVRAALGNGPHTIIAIAENASGMSAPSGALDVTIDSQPLLADVIDVTPDPRKTAVDSILISFNKPVVDFDLSDLTLRRDGGANLLFGSQTLTPIGEKLWLVKGLQSVTAVSGGYVLSVNSAGVHDAAGNSSFSDAQDSWSLSASAPAMDNGTMPPSFSNELIGVLDG